MWPRPPAARHEPGDSPSVPLTTFGSYEEPDIRSMTQEEVRAVVDEAHGFQQRPASVHCIVDRSPAPI
jgi:hypothetical protein